MTSPLDAAATLAGWLEATDIDLLELTGPAGRLRLRRNGRTSADVGESNHPEPDGPHDGTEPLEGVPDSQIVRSSLVGHVLHAHPLRDEPLVRADEPVITGQVLALIRIGALLVPVLAPCDSPCASMLVEDRALVGFGDPLVRLTPSGEG